MTEYIHSGIAGKINRIVKPHIGNILVTSEFGNAKESTLTEDVLKAAVNDINRIKYAVTYKGEKATVDALPTTGNTKGDMWNVAENGHNYAWTGSEWDDLGGTSQNSTSTKYSLFLTDTWSGDVFSSAEKTYALTGPNDSLRYESAIVEYTSHGISFIGTNIPTGYHAINGQFIAYNSGSNSDVTFYFAWPVLYAEDENLGIRAVCELDLSTGFAKLYSIYAADENAPSDSDKIHASLPVRQPGFQFTNFLFPEGSYIKSVKFFGPYWETSTKYCAFNGDPLNIYCK